MIGKEILHYKIKEELGRGGMGVVYLAEDLNLERRVAIKFLPGHIAGNSKERERFKIEAKASAALNHPNITTTYAIEESGKDTFIVMELIDGIELKDIIEGPIPTEKTLSIAIQIAKGLGAAHKKGIVHRDIKSQNIMITEDGKVKIMDFGLAKLQGEMGLTKSGSTLGTVSYMSPEQAISEPVDHRSDIWSFGVVLHEMLTGKLPFEGKNEPAIIYSITYNQPQDLDLIDDESLRAIVKKCLQKDKKERYQNTSELLDDLKKLISSSHYMAIAQKPAKKYTRIKVISLAVIIIILGYVGYRYRAWQKNVGAAQDLLPRIEKLVDEMPWNGEGLQSWRAFELSRKAEKYLAGDPYFEKIQATYCNYVKIITNPAGADVFIKPYGLPDTAWTYLGQTPLDSIRLPFSLLRLKIEKKGFETVRDIAWTVGTERIWYGMSPKEEIPQGMVKVPFKRMGDYFIDRYEVTNGEYKKFMDAGGYSNTDYWKQPFIRNGKEISRSEAMGYFIDKTGVTGPATWEVGYYPSGKDDYPVAGISWYEAAAYAEWAGKSLPSQIHWRHVAALGNSAEIVPFANFNSSSTWVVTESKSMNRFGVYDMAGNVREWCFNGVTGSNERLIVGGGWNDADWLFNDNIAQEPFGRSPTNGFRCIKWDPDSTVDMHSVLAPVLRIKYPSATPVSEDKFEAYSRYYLYDKKPVHAEKENESIYEGWNSETVVIDAVYNNEKIPLNIFLPLNASPPYQAVIYLPGGGSFNSKSSEHLRDFKQVEFFIKSGRAVIYPIYKGTYERSLKENVWDSPVAKRDWLVHWVQDYSRVIDYLETRADIDSSKLIYFGFSWGGWVSTLVLANEKRVKTAILFVAGLPGTPVLPEINPVNFAPRVKVPVLMLTGKYDYNYSLEESQKPLFNLLGTDPKDKKWILYKSGHSVPRQQLIKESLAWLDKYLGSVNKK
jgi:dienelactone hydrolase/predicted Ser/Thr protein kinase